MEESSAVEGALEGHSGELATEAATQARRECSCDGWQLMVGAVLHPSKSLSRVQRHMPDTLLLLLLLLPLLLSGRSCMAWPSASPGEKLAQVSAACTAVLVLSSVR